MEEVAKMLLDKLRKVDPDDQYAIGVKDTLRALFGDEYSGIGQKSITLLDVYDKLVVREVS